MESEKADYQVFNIGSGQRITILEIAKLIAKLFGKNINPEVTNQFRKGDIRHCFADISKIKSLMHWKPRITFADGLEELIEWSHSAKSQDLFDRANKLLKEKGVI